MRRMQWRSSHVFAIVITALAIAWACCAPKSAVAQSVGMKRVSPSSAPVVSVVIDGTYKKLLLSTDTNDILLCVDKPEGIGTMAGSGSTLDDMFMRRTRDLLRIQLRNLQFETKLVALEMPSLNATKEVAVREFTWLGPNALASYLQSNEADGFIGVGYASQAPPWMELLDESMQYRLHLTTERDHDGSHSGSGKGNTAAILDVVATESVGNGEDAQETENYANLSDWSEPFASVNQDELAQPDNNQGIVFPMHHAAFSCYGDLSYRMNTPDSVDTSSGSDSGSPHQRIQVALVEEYSSYWDVQVDFHTACLVLPREFYDSLARWIGLMYNEDLQLSELREDAPGLPVLRFALAHGGVMHRLALDALLLPNMSVGSNLTAMKRFCIQRGDSIPPRNMDNFITRGAQADLVNMLHNPIVFGHMVLSALGDMKVDISAKRVAFQTPRDRADDSDTDDATDSAECLKTAVCTGQQTFNTRTNACIDPDCSLYYFQSLDDTTKECVIDSIWLVFLFTTLAILSTAELCIAHGTQRALRQASTTR